jgi:hypothetical protein
LIVEPDWHDGKLLSLSLESENSLALAGRLHDDVTIRVTVKGLLALRADQFQEENIVDEMAVVAAQDCPDEIVAFLREEGPAAQQRIVRMLGMPGARVLVVECMTGCRVVALFSGELTVSQVHDLTGANS